MGLAEAYDKDHSSIDPSLAGTVLRLAARYGDEELFEHLKERFENAETPAERRRYLSAIGSFKDPGVADAALEYALSPSVRPNESGRIAPAVAHEHRERTVEWTLANYDRVAEKVPTLHLSFMMPALADGRSEELLARVQAFCSDPSRSTPLLQKNLNKVADRVARRARIREKEGPSITAYLSELSQGG